MKLLAALLLAATAWAAADDDPVELLMRVRDRVLVHASRIPNYTCVESIVRDWYDQVATSPPRSCDALPGRRKRASKGTLVRLATTDRLRLDVGIADVREVYSWAGAGHFEEKEIDEFVPPGAIGTGAFAATLLGIFQASDPKFFYDGDTTLNSRRVLQYSFTMPEDQSHTRVKAGDHWLISGYTGTFLVNPETADLLQLNVRTEELPRETNLCEVDSTLEYSMVRLDGADYILPSLTRERYINQSGSEAENAITFSSCREFRGESTVTFGGDPHGATSSEARPALAPSFPVGLTVAVELTSIIDSDKSAGGDPIEGRLAEPILDAAKKTLAPAGAAVEGRLMRVEKRYGNPSEVSIALRWENLQVDGSKVPLWLTPDSRTESRKIAAPGELRQRPVPIQLRRPGEGRYASFQFSGEHVVVSSGLRSQWLTIEP
jgi:hypothetical protein